MTRPLTTTLLACLWATTTAAGACPAYLPAKALPLPAKTTREDLRVFAIATVDGVRTWRSLPVQVEPLDEHGVLMQANEDAPPLTKQLLATNDRIDLLLENFGPKATVNDALPCLGATAVLELGNPEARDRYGYLTMCPGDGGKTLAKEMAPVVVNPAAHTISATRFEYNYQPNNQLMYKSLIAKGPWGSPVLATADADLNLHLDVKNFLTLDFTNEDVESYVGTTNVGKVGAASSIDFFLSVMFFKINLKMATTASFFAGSGHVPSLIDVPMDAPSHLHHGSGLLYSWTQMASAIDQSKPALTMPNALPSDLLAGPEAMVKTGLRYCLGDQCVFRLRGKVATEQFGIDVNIAKKVVEMGFFPVWVPDVAQFKKAMGWDLGPKDGKDRVAVFFPNSGLRKGQYQLDQWIRVGKSADFASVCPRAVQPMGLVKLAPIATAH